MPEDFDLRGTQGAVVLPHGTVVQHYSPPTNEPDMTQQTTTNGDKALHDRVFKHESELADVRARVTIMESLINEMKHPISQIPEIKTLVEHLVKPKSVELGGWSGFSMVLSVVLVVVVLMFMVYAGGTWGG